MATTRTTETTTEAPRIVRDASGREMSALSYTAVYRQKLKEEQLRRISKNKLLKDAAADEAKAKEKEARRAAAEEQLRKEREALAARNAKADDVLRVISVPQVASTDVRETVPKAENIEIVSVPQTPVQVSPVQEQTPVPEKVPAEQTTVKAPAPQAPAKVQSIPSPVVRTAPAAPTAPKTEKPQYIPFTAPARLSYAMPESGVLKIDGAQMRMETDPFDDECYVAVPEAEDNDVIILSDDASTAIPAKKTVDKSDVEVAQDVDGLPTEGKAEPAGEPKDKSVQKNTDDLTDDTDTSLDAEGDKRARRRAKRESRRAKSNRAKAEGRLADEAIRASLAEEARRVAAQTARDEAIARINKDADDGKAALAAMKAEAAAEVLAEKDKEEKKTAEQQAGYRKERKERRDRIRQVQEKHEAVTTAEAEKKSAREQKAAEDEAQKNLRLAAQRAERDSERDRVAAERAEYAALCDPNIKDWRQEVHVSAQTPKTSQAVAQPMSCADADQPLRVAPRKSSYSRSELKTLRLAEEKKIQDDIAAEVALWNEIEIDEEAYAVLPEGIEEMKLRQRRAVLTKELRSFKSRDRACARTIRQLKKVRPSWMTVKAGYEALVSEKALIEALVRAVKLSRLAKRKKYVRGLCENIAHEIKREAKLLRMMKDMTGFAPQATDPMMPKGLKKKTPFKIPTKLYRTE